MNPVSLALKQELDRFMQSIKGNAADKENFKSINTLFNIWNTYKERISNDVYVEKLLGLGDFLFTNQCYKIASLHCYGRYLEIKYPHFQDMAQTLTENTFLSTLFGNLNDTDEVSKMIRGLLGYASTFALHTILQDISFQNKATVDKTLLMMKLLQMTMQVALKKDAYCWLVYNGSIHIYTLCRKLISVGLSSRVLEYLIWACICMESSVPLMTVKYLSWRSELYAAVCQCYYDLKADVVAEEFAKRGLQKINELQEIQKMSTSLETPEVIFAFTQASLKMNAMVFKRSVFESRRRPKGILRPKIKPHLKDIAQNAWPRTGTERLLAEIFKGRAAQFLAILEALTNSNRRLLQTSLGAPDLDECVQDVYVELFFAGVEVASGGGGIQPQLPGRRGPGIKNIITNLTLLDLASAGSQSISLKSIVRFVKLAYNYENWEAFDTLVGATIKELEKYPNDANFIREIKVLKILLAMASFNTSHVKKKVVVLKSEENNGSQFPKNNKAAHVDDLLVVANLVNKDLADKDAANLIISYHDMLIDVALFLWGKCKTHFARINSPIFENHKSIYQDLLFFKWLQILIITQKAMIQLNLQSIDACAAIEASLKLAMVLECLATAHINADSTLYTDLNSQNVFSAKSEKSIDTNAKKNLLIEHLLNIATYLDVSQNGIDVLDFINRMLTLCLNAVNTARDNSLLTSGRVSDDSLQEACSDNVNNMFDMNLNSFHLELTYHHHRIQMLQQVLQKPLDIPKAKIKQTQQKNKKPSITDSVDVLSKAGKNDLSKALYLMSLVQTKSISNPKEVSALLEETYEHLQKAAIVEDRIRSDNIAKGVVSQYVPPPPILLYRGCTSMILKPAEYTPKGGEQIAWYCLYLRNAAGNNVKVRLSDTQYAGTGEQVPYSSNCLFTVKGLEPNQRYVAAIGAYDKKGKLIGGSIGQTGRPFLAAHPLPLILAYAYLAKVAFQDDGWKVAKLSCSGLWNYFVEVKPSEHSNIKTVNNDFKLQPKRIKMNNLNNSSQIVQRYFVQSVFIMVDIAIKEGCLFCDTLCDQGPVKKGQISRLAQCEKLLVAIELSGWLNDNMLCLQAVVKMYGLLTPIIYWKLPIIPVIKILCDMLGVLKEIHTIFKNKRQTAASESLQHMVACISHYVAQHTAKHKDKSATLHVLEMGNKILNQLVPPDSINAGFGDGSSGAGTKYQQKKQYKRNKPKGILKTLSDFSSAGTSLSIRALEIYNTKLQKEGSPDCDLELTGTEDPVILNAVISALPPSQAYKEVLKFKRRAQFLQNFVTVIAKASYNQSHDDVLEWTKDTMAWLTKRNEIILNKPSSDPRGIVVVAANSEDDRLKKYSAGVVEYGKSIDKNLKKIDHNVGTEIFNENEELQQKIEEKLTEIPPGKVLKSNKSTCTTKVIAVMTSEEKRRKDAAAKIQNLLPEVWKSMQRRKKLRDVSLDELPWRCQMNLITADSYFNSTTHTLKLLEEKLGYPDLRFDESIMDVSWFSLSTSGSIIVSWAGCLKTTESIYQKAVDIGGKTMEHAPEIHIVPSPSRQSLSIKVEKIQSVASRKEAIEVPTQDPLKMFKSNLRRMYLHFRRSLVLSHRGENWVLLQQSCANLLAVTHSLMMKIMLLNSSIDTTTHEIPYHISELRAVICKPFSMAADFLLDLMLEMESIRAEDKETSIYGDIHQNKGGSSLKFNPYFDDSSCIDYCNIKRVITFAIEVLFYDEKWEQLCSIIMRFNALSKDHFSESLHPLLIVSQRYLAGRTKANNTFPKLAPRVIFDQDTGVPTEIQYEAAVTTPIEVGAHIDPEGHNLYKVPEDGLKHSSVPTDTLASFKRLHENMAVKHYSSRMLEQSRKLLLLYLAGQQAGVNNEGKLVKETSRVSFVTSQVKPLSADPDDIATQEYEVLEDVENYPLVDNQLAIVISSYDKTIDILLSRRQKELAGQAMHELGNIMFHMKNYRSAYKWWSSALDCILNEKDAQTTWKKYLGSNDNTVEANKDLLERCGVWGCLLGGVVATKIARYIYFANMDMCSQACEMASALFKAIFCSSLTYPSSNHAYSLFDISDHQSFDQIIPGLNFFSDPYRIHCADLTASVSWLSKFLVKQGFYIPVQPLLTLGQYLANFICKNVASAVGVKLMRIESLCKLHMFSGAVQNFVHILSGTHLPAPDMRTQVQRKWAKLKDSRPLTDPKNVKVLTQLIDFTLNEHHLATYGKALCNHISVCHALLMISIAEIIYERPSTEPVVVVEKEAEKVEVFNIKLTKSQSKINSQKSRDKMADVTVTLNSTETFVSLKELKARLLDSAETRLEEMLAQLEATQQDFEEESSSLFVKCRVLLSRICKEKLLVLSAAKHAYICLQAISNSSTDTQNLRTNLSPSVSLFPTKEKPDNPNTDIDIKMWLYCRELVCSYLLDADDVVGQLAGSNLSVVHLTGTAKENIEYGVTESEMFNDSSMKILFEMNQVKHGLKNGEDTDKILTLLEALAKKIDRLTPLSYPLKQVQIEGKILLADLKALKFADVNTAIKEYAEIEQNVLDNMLIRGYDVNTCTNLPVQPYSNIHCELFDVLLAVKVRHSRSKALFVSSNANLGEGVKDWQMLVQYINDALNTYQVITSKDILVQLEFLVLKGKIQRILFNSEYCTLSDCIETFLDVVYISNSHTRDLSLLRQCYIEMGLTFISMLQRKGLTLSDQVKETEPSTKGKKKSTSSNSKLSKPTASKTKIDKNAQRLAKGAWICIRTAGVIAKAQQKSELLAGEAVITSQVITNMAAENIPAFALEDVMGCAYNPSWNISEQGKVDVESQSMKSVEVTWVHLLNYATNLRRNCNYSSLAISNRDVEVVRIPNHCTTRAIKLASVCQYLMTYLSVYDKECCPILPIEIFSIILASLKSSDREICTPTPLDFDETSKLDINISSIKQFDSDDIVDEVFYKEGATSTDKRPVSGTEKQGDKSDRIHLRNPIHAGEYEIALQWYKPELVESKQAQNIYVVAAFNSKPISGNSTSSSFSQSAVLCQSIIDEIKCVAIHDSLMDILQVAEADMAMQGQLSRSAVVFATVTAAQTVSSKSLASGKKNRVPSSVRSSRSEKDDPLKLKLIRVLSHLKQVFGHTDDTREEPSFESTWENIVCLENMFNPNMGHISRVSEGLFSWFLHLFKKSAV
ncbi:cilia- and flagella-associated protein 54-like [Hydractinia symbiolongicarpus]|uniref:cilia- and flagella-associated protein 54-like n=1 Tax=Hydractinia symbiolongicarpus TaxID=13093 RepID=UPI002551722C|nr:cilia- and flagella-associated protein 54-like [Hydractinia symbiolongicarpus]XP_057307242.1 cilia- and flagella-associated protein 54-like [Hydractinia symbiolongicarpus]